MENQKLLKNLKCRGNLLALLLTVAASLFTYNSAWARTFTAGETIYLNLDGHSWFNNDGYYPTLNTSSSAGTEFAVATVYRDDHYYTLTVSKTTSNLSEIYMERTDGTNYHNKYKIDVSSSGSNPQFNLTGDKDNNTWTGTWGAHIEPTIYNFTVYFKRPSDWSNTPNIHMFVGSSPFVDNTPMTKVDDVEGDWYSYDVTTKKVTWKIIFNNGGWGTQTADSDDFSSTDDSFCFTGTNGQKATKTDCPAPSGDAPTVLIADAPSVSGAIATLFGYLKLTGCQNVTDYGFIWSTTQSDIEGTTPSGGATIKATYPTGDITVGNEGTEFKAEDKEFTPQATIYYRAYATNTIGTSYSDEIRSFSTAGCIKPVVTDIGVPANICSNANTIEATAIATAGSTFVWTVDGTVFTVASGTGSTATITVGAAGTGSITVTPTKDDCEGKPFTLSDITVKDATITAKNLKVDGESTTEGETINFCEGQEITFKITSDDDVETYTWDFPTGWTITSGAGTKEVVVTANATSDIVSATITNDCGVSDTRTIVANVTAKPATPGDISGAASVCKGTPQTYSVEAVSGATGYDWILPTGWTGTCDPEGGNTITATPGADAESGTIKVKATNDCGGSEYNTGIEVTVGGYSIAISGVGAKSDAATYPWEYMTLTAETDAENITWNCVYSGTVETDLTVFETNGKTAKLKSGADASDTEHYTVTASSTDGGCQTTSPGYDVYINAADPEICN